MATQPRSGFSINAYVTSFIALTAVVFGVVGLMAFQQIDDVRGQMRDQAVQAARAELNANLQQLVDTLHGALDGLAAWDEVRQQLVDPTYYSYWRDHRLASSGKLPSIRAELVLYGSHGTPLDGLGPALDAPPPAGAWVQRVDDTVVLRSVRTVQPPTRNHPLGYAELRAPLIEILRAGQYPFRYIEPASLHLLMEHDEQVDVAGVGGRTNFVVRADAADESLRDALLSAVLRAGALALFVALLLYGTITAFISLPLRCLSRHIDALSSGTRRQHCPRLFVHELHKVWNSLQDYHGRLSALHRRLDDKNRELWQLAHRDSLTEVFNRRAFEEDIRQAFERTRAGWVALLLFDCNHFKAINDTYGHTVGDAVLRGIAGALGRGLRRGDRLYRMGGDEFAAMYCASTPGKAVALAQRCLDEVRREDFCSYGIREPIKLSIGICEAAVEEVRGYSDLMRRADVAMYHAKRPNRSHLALYSPEMEADSDGLVSHWTRDTVYEVLAGSQALQMHYQPIAHLGSGDVKYYEALARIEREGELILPRQIMPILQSQRLETEFDCAVLRAVYDDLTADHLPAGVGVAVNLAAPSLLDDAAQSAIFRLAKFLPSRAIMLELTETSLIANIERAAEALARLRAEGFVIVLDDFGSGYSSLRYVADMPVDIVKFDLALVHSLGGEQRLGAVVAGLAKLMRETGYELVAEGIECAELAAEARRAGFQLGQGYALGRPMRSPRADACLPVDARDD
ncbi:EAL domain-containing protein [Ectothiorhodospiraceae bacterium 2226]|nr:EAL domain-containing protein [Ectothiorhodospiraceae bacterium 2226]